MLSRLCSGCKSGAARRACLRYATGMTQQYWILNASLDGQRLDLALAACTGMGRRGAHRLLERGQVRLDGRPARKGEMVHVGQKLEILGQNNPSPAEPLTIIARTPSYLAVAKPPGLHTAAVAGDMGDSVEARLALQFPGEGIFLCNRLDGPTSGIVLAAMSEADRERYQHLESAGAVEKTYHAMVAGTVTRPLRLDRALDVARRSVTGVEPFPTADPLRVTRVHPVMRYANHTTLVACGIQKGARHQIRAHLAAAGHPILGDAVYGGPPAARLFLHHMAIRFPGLFALWDTDWEDLADT